MLNSVEASTQPCLMYLMYEMQTRKPQTQYIIH